MRTPSETGTAHSLAVEALIALVLVAALVGSGGLGVSALAAGQETEPLRIDVTLDEYSFAPEPLRIPAGRPVTLVIRNAGKVAHEFMAGREVEGNDFRQDLFADLHVNIEPAEMAAASHDEHAAAGHDADAGRDAAAGHDADAGRDAAAGHDADAGRDADAGHDDHDAGHDAPEAAEHAHAEGHAHGTMVEADAGKTFLMTFTLPEDRRGEWATGCFLSGHYEAGMHGTLIVE